ncbi:SDR family oxidoreductase [Pseudooceanicola nanhaiensis]|uniref:SDR family oxidoreductase n=1 Tax=Pseudooceanicola nanhaiensis TaxID=375761 RepID=UPI001CD1D138|nr:SDR family oxidoreductase [Pseudooceanicola nanhaiensis]MCA0922171.1 SDR family oxidoreductase [Pseudooceanicola nanhaiensis]
MTLQDQPILVLGGSSGIGFGVAKAACDAGARVTIASRSQEKVDAAASKLGATGVTLDTGDAEALEAFFANTSFAHVFCSAASTKVDAVRSLLLEDAYASVQSKFWGAYRVARAASIRDGGSLTLVSGFLSVRPKKGAAIQGAINAAIEGLTRGLALELAPVRVNCISPGLIQTEMYDSLDGDGRKAMFDGAAERLPVGRVGGPEHIATQAIALMSNPYMTGTTVLVDGGGAIA